MGRRRMKTNGDEKETHLAETTATYALGVFCQLVNPYISGVDHHKKGFMKDFFDAVLEDDGLRNPLPQHHRNRKPGKTTITTGVWSGINDTDLTRFYNGRKKIPAWKAAEFLSAPRYLESRTLPIFKRSLSRQILELRISVSFLLPQENGFCQYSRRMPVDVTFSSTA